MAISRQRFGNTRSRGNEQMGKSTASQRLAKHTVSWQQNNTRTVEDGDLYSVRLEVSSVQES
jgi:hypothetical protein